MNKEALVDKFWKVIEK